MDTTCSHCGKEYEVSQESLGQSVDCISCGKMFVIADIGAQKRQTEAAKAEAAKAEAARIEAEKNAEAARMAAAQFEAAKAAAAKAEAERMEAKRNARNVPPPRYVPPDGYYSDGSGKREKSTADFWAFRKMIAPELIKVLFVIDVILTLVGGAYFVYPCLVRMVNSEELIQSFGFFALAIVILLATTFLLLLTRVFYEYTIVIFKINDTLTDIRSDIRNAVKHNSRR